MHTINAILHVIEILYINTSNFTIFTQIFNNFIFPVCRETFKHQFPTIKLALNTIFSIIFTDFRTSCCLCYLGKSRKEPFVSISAGRRWPVKLICEEFRKSSKNKTSKFTHNYLTVSRKSGFFIVFFMFFINFSNESSNLVL